MGKRTRKRRRSSTQPEPEFTYDEQRRQLDLIADRIGMYHGIPSPVDGFDITLAPSHPLAEFYAKPEPDVRVVVGGPARDGDDELDLDEAVFRCFVDDSEQIVNEWYDATHNRDVLIFQKAGGRAFAVKAPRAPDRSMDRLNFALMTLGASDAWSMEAEAKAVESLQSHVTERQLRHYLLTGMFLETSRRSSLTYVFRRLRPTVVLTPRKGDTMSVLAVLCLHPIGYYDRTWAGCMVPTDDVLAHLLLMRGDEAGYWRQANQHDPASPEAGL